MRPLRLSMKGFGAFREPTEIDFTDIDLMALVGATGSGKSTIIDAMSFALYGNVARYDDNREVAAAINQTSNEARVHFVFELGEQVYTATRIVRRTAKGATTKEARLERGDEVLAAEARPMSTAVAELLGLDFEQFNRTVVLPQGRFADFLHDKPSDRQTILVQLLGADLYRRMGQEARRRSAHSSAQADALRPELDSESEQLTDERRTELDARIALTNEARSHLKIARAAIETIEDDITAWKDRLETLDEQVRRLAEVVAPDDVAEVASLIRDATNQHRAAVQLREEQSNVRRRAIEAASTGPDLADVRLALKAHADAKQLGEQHAEVSALLVSARAEFETAKAEADVLRAAQHNLDLHAAECLAAERDGRSTRDSMTPIAQVDSWTRAYARASDSSTRVAAIGGELDVAETTLEQAEHALTECETALAAATDNLDNLRHRQGVLGYTDMLVAGEPCPLCLQGVHELPHHNLDVELADGQARVSVAKAARRDAKLARDGAHTAVLSYRAELTSAEKLVDSSRVALADAPPESELAALRTAIEHQVALVKAAEVATLNAEAAAKAHREFPRTALAFQVESDATRSVDELTTTEVDLARRVVAARSMIEKVPPQGELEGQRLEAERLQEAVEGANRVFEAAEQAEADAMSARRAAIERADGATAYLRSTRDRVAEFGPPPVDGTDLSGSWEALTSWAESARSQAETERLGIEERVRTQKAERTALTEQALKECEAALGELDHGLSLESIANLLTESRAHAVSDLKQFEQRRAALAGLQERVDGLVEESVVAGKLGHLLRTDGFESWLMETALEELVDRATKRLFELSGGQYSLEIDKREFAVRDHTNVDELRSARTLSGGETFLASLSLALALADATAELAPEGAPHMESIFLDEGFGTLDPNTLDTVAAAIEELGASGRLVGIVTHIRELAERMPVRLEVTKVGGSATVERVEI